MDCFAIHLFFLASSRREAEKGCRDQCSLLGYGAVAPSLPLDGLHRNPSLSHLLQTAAKRRKGAGNKFPAGVWGDAPSFPLDGLHRNPSLSHLLQTAAKRRKGAGNKFPAGVWDKAPSFPLVPRPSPPSLDAYLSPFHHRRTRSARKRIKLPVRHVLDSVVRLHRTRRRRSRRRYAVAMRRRHAPA